MSNGDFTVYDFVRAAEKIPTRANNCEHIYGWYSGWDCLLESKERLKKTKEDMKKYNSYIEFEDFFYCPKCGMKLDG